MWGGGDMKLYSQQQTTRSQNKKKQKKNCYLEFIHTAIKTGLNLYTIFFVHT